MTSRILKVLENGGYVGRGFYQDEDGYYAANQDTNETLKYTLDLSDWLGTATISSVAYEDSSLTRAVSEGTQTITLTISGVTGGSVGTDYGARSGSPAWTRARITTSTSEIKDVTLRFYEVEA